MNRAFYAIMLIVGISIMIMPLSVPVFKSNAAYSVLNTGPEGVSSFGKLLYSKGDIAPVLSTYDSMDLGEKKGTLIVVGPSLDFTEEEILELREFLENGNTLILADDFGTGNEILEGLGLKQRFARGELITPIYSKNHTYPITSEIVEPALARNVERIVMHEPAVILNPQNALVYTANSSLFKNSYGAFAIVDMAEYGRGRVILVSDPDIFTNSLFGENEEFIRNLLDYAGGPFFIDEAHHRDFNPYSSGTITIRRAVDKELIFYYILFVAAIAFIIETGLWLKVLEKLFSILLLFVREKKESLEETIKSLEEEGLDREVLMRIIEEIKTGSKLGGNYGG